LGSIDSLPTLPEIYDELMGEIASEDSSLEHVGEIIARDMALSSSVLKLVNSAFFALVRHIETPAQAAAILGADTIKNLALSNSVFSSFKGSQADREYLRKLNSEGQQIGMLAIEFAKLCDVEGRSKDHVQMAGMMVNVGSLVALLLREERAAGEVDNPDSGLLGAYLLGIWAMPFPIVEAVRWHQRPAESNIDVLSPLAIVHGAWAMQKIFSEQQEIDLESDLLDTSYLASIAGPDMVDQWKEAAENFFCGRG